MYPREIVDRVREATDIVGVISRHVNLKRRGGNYVGLCPFHQEKSPSFNVIPHKHMYHCFGCQKSGDAYRFLQEIEGLSFPEAVKELAQAASIALPEKDLTPEQKRHYKQRATLFDVMEAAAAYYSAQLWTKPAGESARTYLKDRGFEDEFAQSVGLGLAANEWSELSQHLRRQGYRDDLIVESGLARHRNNGNGIYDAFRGRLMVPIRDEKGRTIAFGGRTLVGDDAKYINSPETPLYNKSTVLYGMDRARQQIQRENMAIIVEGYFDVLALSQAGFENVIGVCGTKLTEGHLKMLHRLTTEVLVLFDADEAGSKAAETALGLFLDCGMQPWRIEMPGAKDPDELLHEGGPEAMQAALDAKRPLLDWVIDRRLRKLEYSAIGKQRILEELIPSIVDFPQATWSTVAARLAIPEISVIQSIQKYRKTRHARPPENYEQYEQYADHEDHGDHEPFEEPSPSWKPRREVVHILWLLVHRYDQVADIFSRVEPEFFGEPDFVEGVIGRLITGEPTVAVLHDITDPVLKRTLEAVVARDELYSEEQAELGACEILSQLMSRPHDEKLSQLTQDIENALRKKDPKLHKSAAQERERTIKLNVRLKRALLSKDVSSFLLILEEQSGANDKNVK